MKCKGWRWAWGQGKGTHRHEAPPSCLCAFPYYVPPYQVGPILPPLHVTKSRLRLARARISTRAACDLRSTCPWTLCLPPDSSLFPNSLCGSDGSFRISSELYPAAEAKKTAMILLDLWEGGGHLLTWAKRPAVGHAAESGSEQRVSLVRTGKLKSRRHGGIGC